MEAVNRQANDVIKSKAMVVEVLVDEDEHPYIDGYNPFVEYVDQGELPIPNPRYKFWHAVYAYQRQI